MPKKLERCVAHVKASNARSERKKKMNPWAVCVASTGLKPHKGGKKK